MDKKLNGKVAVVTGGSRGLGLAIARTFAAEGARLYLVARNAGHLERAVSAITSAQDCEIHTHSVDITSYRAADSIAEAALERFGAIDVLVNSAGVYVHRKLEQLSEEDWRRTLESNLTAPFLLTHAVTSRMVERKLPGSVINIASVHGAVGDAHAVPQCAAKAGLIGLTRACAESLRQHGVRVNAISPGAIEPDSAFTLSGALDTKVTQADVAQMAVYLASDAARGITGTNMEAYGVTRPAIASS